MDPQAAALASQVYVFGTSSSSSTELTALFSTIGPMTNPFIKIGNYGFAHYHNEDNARLAISRLNGYKINGSTTLVVRHPQTPRNRTVLAAGTDSGASSAASFGVSGTSGVVPAASPAESSRRGYEERRSRRGAYKGVERCDPRSRYDSDAYPPRSRTGRSRSRSHSRSRERDLHRRSDDSRFASERSSGSSSLMRAEYERGREPSSSRHTYPHNDGSKSRDSAPRSGSDVAPALLPPTAGSEASSRAGTHPDSARNRIPPSTPNTTTTLAATSATSHTTATASTAKATAVVPTAAAVAPAVGGVVTAAAPSEAGVDMKDTSMLPAMVARIFVVDAALRGYAEFVRGKLHSDAHIQTEIVLATGISPVPRPQTRPEDVQPARIPQPIDEARAAGLRYLIAIGWREEKTMTLVVSYVGNPLIRDSSAAAKAVVAAISQEEERNRSLLLAVMHPHHNTAALGVPSGTTSTGSGSGAVVDAIQHQSPLRSSLTAPHSHSSNSNTSSVSASGKAGSSSVFASDRTGGSGGGVSRSNTMSGQGQWGGCNATERLPGTPTTAASAVTPESTQLLYGTRDRYCSPSAASTILLQDVRDVARGTTTSRVEGTPSSTAGTGTGSTTAISAPGRGATSDVEKGAGTTASTAASSRVFTPAVVSGSKLASAVLKTAPTAAPGPTRSSGGGSYGSSGGGGGSYGSSGGGGGSYGSSGGGGGSYGSSANGTGLLATPSGGKSSGGPPPSGLSCSNCRERTHCVGQCSSWCRFYQNGNCNRTPCPMEHRECDRPKPKAHDPRRPPPNINAKGSVAAVT